MFSNSKFNVDISKWNVSNVIEAESMFYDSNFKGDIFNWNLVNCTDDLKLNNYAKTEHMIYLKDKYPEYFFV